MGYVKNEWSKTDFLIKCLDDSAWLCMEKLKKHSVETKKQKNKNTKSISKNTEQ